LEKVNYEEKSSGRVEYISILLVKWGNAFIMLLLSFLISYINTDKLLLIRFRLGI
jgi:hypothetical protein